MSKESTLLKENVQAQLARLLDQMSDLEELAGELDEDEIEEMRAETIEEMKQFEATLAKMMSSNDQLVDDLSRHRTAIQEAIRGSFATPDVIRMFTSKSGAQLRQRLAQIDRDTKLGNLNERDHSRKKIEVLTALKKLGETLSDEESAILQETSRRRFSDDGVGGVGAYTEASTDVAKSSAALSSLKLKD